MCFTANKLIPQGIPVLRFRAGLGMLFFIIDRGTNTCVGIVMKIVKIYEKSVYVSGSMS